MSDLYGHGCVGGRPRRARTRRTARGSTPRDSCEVSATSSSVWARRSSRTPTVTRIVPRRGSGAGRGRHGRRPTSTPTSSCERPKAFTPNLPRRTPHRRAALLADDRDRTAVARVLGRGRLRPATRPSPTTATSSSTASARATTESPSAAAARPTTSDHRSRRDSTRITRSSRNSRGPCASCSRRSTGRSPTRGAVRSAMPRDHSPFGRAWTSDSGLASAGGYTGDGVVLSHVAATRARRSRSRARTPRPRFTRLPFVQHRARQWEFEPLALAGHQRGPRRSPRGPTTSSDARAARAARAAWLERLSSESLSAGC